MTPKEYFDLCAKHDWFYDYSDDHSKWRAGNDEYKTLMNWKKENTLFQDIFDAWAYHVFSGGIQPQLPYFSHEV